MILGFYGPSSSGKTELITRLVESLSARGFLVGYIKHTHEKFDVEGKDTWRVYESGAKFVCAISNNESFVRIQGSYNVESISKFLPVVDIVFVEGFRELSIPKIKVGECETYENTVFDYNSNFEEILEWVLKQLEEGRREVSERVQLLVNDKKIPLKGFVQTVIKEIILALIKTLKDVDKDNIKEIHIDVKIS